MASRHDAVDVDVLQRCRALAEEMVQLEGWAREAARRRWFERVGELHTRYDEVREVRSALLRQVWRPRRRR